MDMRFFVVIETTQMKNLMADLQRYLQEEGKDAGLSFVKNLIPLLHCLSLH